MVSLGLPLVICEVSFRSRLGAESSKCERPCWSSIDLIVIGHIFFSTPMKRDTALPTEVQQTSGFILIKTVPRLNLALNEKSQRRYTQQATNKCSTKSSCGVLHKHLLRYKISSKKLFQSPFELWRATCMFNFSDAFIFR